MAELLPKLEITELNDNMFSLSLKPWGPGESQRKYNAIMKKPHEDKMCKAAPCEGSHVEAHCHWSRLKQGLSGCLLHNTTSHKEWQCNPQLNEEQYVERILGNNKFRRAEHKITRNEAKLQYKTFHAEMYPQSDGEKVIQDQINSLMRTTNELLWLNKEQRKVIEQLTIAHNNNIKLIKDTVERNGQETFNLQQRVNHLEAAANHAMAMQMNDPAWNHAHLRNTLPPWQHPPHQ